MSSLPVSASLIAPDTNCLHYLIQLRIKCYLVCVALYRIETCIENFYKTRLLLLLLFLFFLLFTFALSLFLFLFLFIRFIHLFIYLFVPSFIPSFIHSSVYLFIYLFYFLFFFNFRSSFSFCIALFLFSSFSLMKLRLHSFKASKH